MVLWVVWDIQMGLGSFFFHRLPVQTGPLRNCAEVPFPLEGSYCASLSYWAVINP